MKTLVTIASALVALFAVTAEARADYASECTAQKPEGADANTKCKKLVEHEAKCQHSFDLQNHHAFAVEAYKNASEAVRGEVRAVDDQIDKLLRELEDLTPFLPKSCKYGGSRSPNAASCKPFREEAAAVRNANIQHLRDISARIAGLHKHFAEAMEKSTRLRDAARREEKKLGIACSNKGP